METPEQDRKLGIVDYLKPVNFVIGLFTFLLGLALVSFLNIEINWTPVIIGYALLLSTQGGEGVIAWGRAEDNQPGLNGAKRKFTLAMAISAVLFMLIAGLLAILLNQTRNNSTLILITVIMLVLTLARSLIFSEKRLLSYQEIFDSIVLVGLYPAFSFVVATGELHRLLALISIPLVFIFLGAKVGLAFPKYASDLSGRRDTLLIKLGWQNGIILHDLSLLGGVILLGVAGLIGLTWQLVWPNILLLPLIITELMIVHRMAEGAKRNWRLLKVNAYSIIFLSIYIQIFSLLIN